VLSAYHPLQSFPRLRGADPRVAATATLVGVVLAAALAALLQPSSPASPERAADGSARVERTPAAPVKIIGAPPRSESCAGQVWPYIESRCLVRAVAEPRTTAETGGAAPANAPLPPAVAESRVEPRRAVAHLRLPPRRQVDRLSPVTDAWAGDAIEAPNEATPRRRAGRRAYRGRGWGRRLGFPFGF
jgi:hypothetical protein